MTIFTVTTFVQYINDTLKAIWDANEVAVEGEVSEFKVSQGQWVNFNLKDEETVVNVFTTTWKLQVPLQDGMKVRVLGNPRIYPKFGKFSISAEKIDLIGEGGLRKALEALRQKLLVEGLFDTTRKRTLPRFPRRIALIASRESAAYGDFIRIINERWRGLEIDLYHVQVQGEDAPRQIIHAIQAANTSGAHFVASDEPGYDAIILTRGGGSLEELMAFNNEALVRAIYASTIPTLVGIGHERDITLAEEVADIRGSTPTDCARRLVPDRQDVIYELATMQTTISESIDEVITVRLRLIDDVTLTVDHWLQKVRTKIEPMVNEMSQRVNFWFEQMSQRVNHLAKFVATFDPHFVLKRGYAIVRDSSGHPLTNKAQVTKAQSLALQLHDGSVNVMIEDKEQPRLL